MMRAIRLVIAALIGMALAVAPVSAGLMQPLTHAGHVEMSAGTPDDADLCCDATQDAAAGCSLKCCSVLAILVAPEPLPGLRAPPEPDMIVAALTPFTRQPDPPPPRA